MATHHRRPGDVTHHSDQGCEHTSYAFGKRCRQPGVRPSMGTVDDTYDNTLFPALKNVEGGPGTQGNDAEANAARALRRRRLLVKSVCEDAYQCMKSGTLMRQGINKIQADIDLNDATNQHVFGDIYEKILKDLQGAGNAGEY